MFMKKAVNVSCLFFAPLIVRTYVTLDFQSDCDCEALVREEGTKSLQLIAELIIPN